MNSAETQSSLDVFVSYTGADEAWATWVAAVLEAEGRTVAVQAWDSPAGTNIVAWINRQMTAAKRTVAICSRAYFALHWGTQEWAAALAGKTLIPLRVEDCPIPPVLATIAYRDLHDVDEATARRRLVEAVGLARPDRRSSGFPGRLALPADAVFPDWPPSDARPGDADELSTLRDLVAGSSLGTEGARLLRNRIPRASAERVVQAVVSGDLGDIDATMAAVLSTAVTTGTEPADPISVAVVDDHPVVLRSLAGALGGLEGVALVATATSLRELLAGPGRDADVVLLDLDLGDGSQVTENIRNLIDGGASVIVVSAVAEPDTIRAAIRAGACGFVSKTDDVGGLATAIRTASTGNAWVSPQLAFLLLTDSAPDRPTLSRQEREALQLYATGMPLKAVARKMAVSPETAKQYIQRVRLKYRGIGRRMPHDSEDLGAVVPSSPAGRRDGFGKPEGRSAAVFRTDKDRNQPEPDREGPHQGR